MPSGTDNIYVITAPEACIGYELLPRWEHAKYRLVVAINYPFRICYVRFIGTHHAYDRVDVDTV